MREVGGKLGAELGNGAAVSVQSLRSLRSALLPKRRLQVFVLGRLSSRSSGVGHFRDKVGGAGGGCERGIQMALKCKSASAAPIPPRLPALLTDCPH